jgi:hypothetical protein
MFTVMLENTSILRTWRTAARLNMSGRTLLTSGHHSIYDEEVTCVLKVIVIAALGMEMK